MTDRNITRSCKAVQPPKKKKVAKLTKEIFIERAKAIHGDKYDYSQTEIINATTKVKIFCKACNAYFEQQPNSHTSQKSGCYVCGKQAAIINRTHKFDEFVERAVAKHGIGRYDYSKCEYKNLATRIKILCLKCGCYFLQQPSCHLAGQGCANCAGCKKSNLEEFIRKFKTKYKEKPITFEKSVYVNAITKMTVTCSIHGDFETKPNWLLSGQGCAKCVNAATSKRQTKGYGNFLSRATKTHGDTYKYDKLSYTGSNNKLKIHCEYHGWFEQRAIDHIKGHGCVKCGRDLNGFGRSNFIEIAQKHDRLATLYLVEFFDDKEKFFKVGITTRTVKQRFNVKNTPYNFKELVTINGDAGYIYDLEKKIHSLLKEHHYTPNKHFKGGVYECFSHIPKSVIKLLKDLGNTPQLQLIA